MLPVCPNANSTASRSASSITPSRLMSPAGRLKFWLTVLLSETACPLTEPAYPPAC